MGGFPGQQPSGQQGSGKKKGGNHQRGGQQDIRLSEPAPMTAIQRAEARAKAAAAEAEAQAKAAAAAAREKKATRAKAVAEAKMADCAKAADEAMASEPPKPMIDAQAEHTMTAKTSDVTKTAAETFKANPEVESFEDECAEQATETATQQLFEEATYAPVPEEVELSVLQRPSATINDLKVRDEREHLNLVFIGHVDAGKSTFCGRILYDTGQVDARTIEKYEKEAKEKNRESWFLAFIMDTNEEERAKGKTVEVGRAHFESTAKRYTILDAPGHKNYVPNMIAGACQADVGVLVISARKGEFETGFEKGGQTREHALLAKTLGVRLLVVVINKMDDPTVEWDQVRYDECTEKLQPFLKQCGYNIKKDVIFIPISALNSQNVGKRVSVEVAPWYSGPTFLECLDSLPTADRDKRAPLRLPILSKYKDMGTMVEGKVEQGTVTVGDKLFVMPNRTPVEVLNVWLDQEEASYLIGGENARVKLKDISDEDIQPGFVLSPRGDAAVKAVRRFEVQLAIVELLEHKSIFSAGYTAILHVHAVAEECQVIKLTSQINKKTGARSKRAPMFVKAGAVITCVVEVEQAVCIEPFDVCPQLGRFTLRDEGRTIGIGKIQDLSQDTEAGQ